MGGIAREQNTVLMSGTLTDLAPATRRLGDVVIEGLYGTLITDLPLYGGHHTILITEEALMREIVSYGRFMAEPLEVSVIGWLRSSPLSKPGELTPAVVVASRLQYLNATEAVRRQVRNILRNIDARP